MNQTNVKSTATLNNKEIKYLFNTKDGDEKIMTNLDKGRLDSAEAQEHNKTESSTKYHNKTCVLAKEIKFLSNTKDSRDDNLRNQSNVKLM